LGFEEVCHDFIETFLKYGDAGSPLFVSEGLTINSLFTASLSR
jgi:hypothetical protein